MTLEKNYMLFKLFSINYMSYKKIYMSFNIKRHIHAHVIFRCELLPSVGSKQARRDPPSLPPHNFPPFFPTQEQLMVLFCCRQRICYLHRYHDPSSM